MKILMVLTSHEQLGASGEKTGFWFEEFAVPYYLFKDAGAEITLASPKGGNPPLDPRSDDDKIESVNRFKQDPQSLEKLHHTHKLKEINTSEYDALFYPGGHGPMWDLSQDQDSARLIEEFYTAGKPVALVCHGPIALRAVKDKQGQSFLKDKKVTGFSNSEEKAVDLDQVVPFLLEDEFKRLGANYTKGPDWGAYVVRDGVLITGQNPASSAEAAERVLDFF